MENDRNPLDEAVLAYARTLGLDVNDPQVKKYATQMQGRTVKEDRRPTRIHVQRPDPVAMQKRRYEDAVARYAQSQGLSMEDEQVQRYAKGLLDLFQEIEKGQKERSNAH